MSNNIDIFSVEYFLNFVEVLIRRIEGTSELMAVVSNGMNSITIFLDFLFGGSLKKEILFQTFGFNHQLPGKAFGLTLGLTGMLSLSGSYFVIFFGTIFYLANAFYFERLFLKSNYIYSSIFVGTSLMVITWNNMTWSLYYKYVIIITLSYLALKFINNFFLKTK